MITLLLLIVFAASALLFLPVGTAAAEEDTYLLIDRDNVSLYKNTLKMEALFTIPRTFYVKVLEANYAENYHRVEYNGIEGLLKTSEVSGKTATNVQDPYYTQKSISPHVSTHLFKRPSFKDSEDSGIVAYGLSLTYLGKISGEKGTFGTQTWFAVLYAENVYYIHSANTENLDLLEASFAPVHPNSASESGSSVTDPEEKKDEDKKGGSKANIVRILLILGMFVPIVVILVVLFRPRKKRRSKSDKEEEDDDY